MVPLPLLNTIQKRMRRREKSIFSNLLTSCLLYTSDAADDTLRVDAAFFASQHKVNINGVISIKNGGEICGPVTVAEHYFRENEKKREIYLLKPAYFQSFVDDFRKKNLYKRDDNNYISQRLKKTG